MAQGQSLRHRCNTAVVCRSLGGLLLQIYDIFVTYQNGRSSAGGVAEDCGCVCGC